MYHYKAKLLRVVDGDTIDVDIDLGFDVWLRKQRIRLAGIDTPESRTRNKAEKALGLQAKAFLEKALTTGDDHITFESLGRGKFGRILGKPYNANGLDICKLMIDSGNAVEYWGGKKTKVWG